MHNVNVLDNFDPKNLNRELFIELCSKYGGARFADKFPTSPDEVCDVQWGTPEDQADLDEFSRCGIKEAADIRDLFVPGFFFGCEGDDDVTAWAFNAKHNPFNVRLNVILGSDIGHRDLFDMRDAAAEPWELVEKGLITEEDFRDFVFVNPVKLHAGMNPNFFKGTVVEKEVDALLAASNVDARR
jgi:hypothetical protein